MKSTARAQLVEHHDLLKSGLDEKQNMRIFSNGEPRTAHNNQEEMHNSEAPIVQTNILSEEEKEDIANRVMSLLVPVMESEMEVIKGNMKQRLKTLLSVGGGSAIDSEKLELPPNAPELYKERKNKREKAPEFLRRVWGKYIDTGLLCQSDIRRRFDQPLYGGLSGYCRNKGIPVTAYLPASSGGTKKIDIQELVDLVVKSTLDS